MLSARDIEQHFEPTHGDNSLSSLNSQPVQTYPNINQAAFYGLAGILSKPLNPSAKPTL